MRLLEFLPYLPVAILGTVATVMWLVAMGLFIRTKVSSSKGVRVQGRVTGYNDFASRRGRRMYSAIYEATVPDGRTLQCTSGIAMSWQSPPVGTVATLLYRPHDPQKPLVTLGFSRFMVATIFAGTAAVFTMSALTWGFQAYRTQQTIADAIGPHGGPATPALPELANANGSPALVAPSLTSITGGVHSAGGELGTWDVVLSDCRSGEVNGFYGVDFYAAGSDQLRLRYVHDEAKGEIVKIAYPSKPGTVNVFDRDDRCTVLEGAIEKTNFVTSTPKGKIRHLNGHVKFDCTHPGEQGHVTGQATFSHCH